MGVWFKFSEKKGRFNMMRLNVGLSRKVSDNHYGSKGGNVNLEVEVDSAMLGDPSKLKLHMQKLFELARNALDEEVGKIAVKPEMLHTPAKIPAIQDHQVEKPSQNGSIRRASEKQLALIQGLLRKGKIPYQPLLDARNVGSFNELTVKEASLLIGELKAEIS